MSDRIVCRRQWREVAPAVALLLVLVAAGFVVNYWRLRAQRAHADLLALRAAAEGSAVAEQTALKAPAAGAAAAVTRDQLRAHWQELGRALPEATSLRAWTEAPPDRNSALLELAAMRLRYRAAAEANGVALRPGEAFAFHTYLESGPDDALLPVVHRQSVAVGAVLDALLAARPLSLDGVARERPRPGVAVTSARRLDHEADYFDRSAAFAADPGAFGSVWIRIRFSGTTQVLRRFCHAAAESADPLVVRLVEVEPAEVPIEEIETTAETPPRVVAVGRARFSVVVEVVPQATLAARWAEQEGKLWP